MLHCILDFIMVVSLGVAVACILGLLVRELIKSVLREEAEGVVLMLASICMIIAVVTHAIGHNL